MSSSKSIDLISVIAPLFLLPTFPTLTSLQILSDIAHYQIRISRARQYRRKRERRRQEPLRHCCRLSPRCPHARWPLCLEGRATLRIGVEWGGTAISSSCARCPSARIQEYTNVPYESWCLDHLVPLGIVQDPSVFREIKLPLCPLLDVIM